MSQYIDPLHEAHIGTSGCSRRWTEQGPFHYVWNRHAPDPGSFPQVKDRTCNLAAADGLPRLTCDAETVTVAP